MSDPEPISGKQHGLLKPTERIQPDGPGRGPMSAMVAQKSAHFGA